MANRVIRDWTTSEKIDSLSELGELFFVRLIMKADDHGCFHANPKLLKAALFPLKDYSETQMTSILSELELAGVVLVYEHEGRQYLKINDFGQRLRNMVSKFPQPADNPRPLDSNKPPETKRNEVETETETRENDETLPAFGIDVSVKKLLTDEKWVNDIRHLTKGKNLEGAARSAFLFLESKPQRFKQADLNELKRTTLSWLENNKPLYTNGKSDQRKADAVIESGKDFGTFS